MASSLAKLGPTEEDDTEVQVLHHSRERNTAVVASRSASSYRANNFALSFPLHTENPECVRAQIRAFAEFGLLRMYHGTASTEASAMMLDQPGICNHGQSGLNLQVIETCPGDIVYCGSDSPVSCAIPHAILTPDCRVSFKATRSEQGTAGHTYELMPPVKRELPSVDDHHQVVQNDKPIKRPRTAYVEFRSANYPVIRNANPQKTYGELLKEVGRAWKALSAHERLPYEQAAASNRRNYVAEMQNLFMAALPHQNE